MHDKDWPYIGPDAQRLITKTGCKKQVMPKVHALLTCVSANTRPENDQVLYFPIIRISTQRYSARTRYTAVL